LEMLRCRSASLRSISAFLWRSVWRPVAVGFLSRSQGDGASGQVAYDAGRAEDARDWRCSAALVGRFCKSVEHSCYPVASSGVRVGVLWRLDFSLA
jgi:hypothetical protein